MYTFYLEGSIDWTLLRLDFRSIINFMSRAKISINSEKYGNKLLYITF